MPTPHQTAAAASRHRFDLGTPDYDLRFELETFAEEEAAEAERLEAEGRREMYEMLDLGAY